MTHPTTESLLTAAINGDTRALARCISIAENDLQGADQLLESLPPKNKDAHVTGITGPPGAGKSTLVSALVSNLLAKHPDSKVAVLAVDPTSPFTHGAILGDRLRMSDHYNDPRVYIRSVATRGALGGLSNKTPQIADVLLAAGYKHIIIETVGVGQSELEIASLADTTVVVFVPESGDEVQTIKSGIMEIADIFVINKSDREGAEKLSKSIITTLHERPASDWTPPVIMTAATVGKGIDELTNQIAKHQNSGNLHTHQSDLLLDKAYRLLQQQLIRNIDTEQFSKALKDRASESGFNLYRFIREYLNIKL